MDMTTISFIRKARNQRKAKRPMRGRLGGRRMSVAVVRCKPYIAQTKTIVFSTAGGQNRSSERDVSAWGSKNCNRLPAGKGAPSHLGNYLASHLLWHLPCHRH